MKITGIKVCKDTHRCHYHVVSILLISQVVKMLYNRYIVLYQCLNGARGPDKQKILYLLGE